MTSIKENHDISKLWLAFTNMNDFYKHPLIISSAQGSVVTDTEGKNYIDCISGLWHVGVGHGNTFYLERIKKQLESGLTTATIFGSASELAIEYAERLTDFIGTPPLNHVFLSNSGSEAVETALKIAIQYNRLLGKKGTKIAYLSNAYHGVTLGSLSAMGIPGDRKDFEPYLSPRFISSRVMLQ